MCNDLIGLTKACGFTIQKCVWNVLRVVQSLPDSLKNINLLDDGSDMQTGVQWDAIKN
jgi:hypothetical protein